MKTHIRYLLEDSNSLDQYFQLHKAVTLDDVKRHLFLLARESNVRIPDHIYRLAAEKTFTDIHSLSHLFTIGLTQLSEEYLEVKQDKVYVKACKQNEWQLLLTKIPPLLLVACRIWRNHSVISPTNTDFLTHYIAPNVKHTALPSPQIPQMEEMRKRHNGLCDMHVHLNGALETDLTWQDMLAHPQEVYSEIKKANVKEKVKEQYDNILGSYYSPWTLYSLLKRAIIIRQLLYTYVIDPDDDSIPYKFQSFDHLLAHIEFYAETNVLSLPRYDATDKHPMRLLMGEVGNDLQLECLMYIHILNFLSRYPNNDTVARLFHYYLLILGLFNRMLVQQIQCNGFEQFQKYTMNGVREYSERQYVKRFLQMAGNELTNIHRIEGKFSPKDSIDKNDALVAKIHDGWIKLHNLLKEKQLQKPEFQLTAHFIKQPDKIRPDDYMRFQRLRHEIMYKAKILADWRRSHIKYAFMFSSIDAAASELDTPPEVFAPVYHYLREEGFLHFTYHAGEDFYHILSGMRAVYEAIDFLGLVHGDRIGHATACGLPVHVWHENIGPKLLIRKGEWMDDLVFAAYIINKYQAPQLLSMLPVLHLMISNYSQEIYDKNYSLSELIHSWLIRKEDPEPLYWKYPKSQDIPDKYKLYLEYHTPEVAKRYDEIIEIDSCKPFDEEGLEILQKLALRYMHEKEIVIEMMPTSNVLISHHHDYSTYHFSSWLKWQKEGYPIPAIVLGTDDTGIFATNIYNEYCNIFCHLVYHDKMNSYDALKALEQIDYNSRIYAFKDNIPDDQLENRFLKKKS